MEAAKLAPRHAPELALVYEKEKQKGECQSCDPGGRAQAGGISAWPWTGEQQDFELRENSGNCGLNRWLAKENQNYTARRLPGLARCAGLGEGEKSLEALLGLFRDWQRTQTQSSVKALTGPRQQMDVRFCESRNHRREAPMRAEEF